MATPNFSNGIIGNLTKEFINRNAYRSNGHYILSVEQVKMFEQELCKKIKNYFEERKCSIDKHLTQTICELCKEDNIIEKDLIGVFVIAK